MFANIKMKSSLIDAPTHLFDQIRFTREHCEPAEQKVIFDSIQQNSYMAHPESVILTMLGMKNNEIPGAHLVYSVHCTVGAQLLS